MIAITATLKNAYLHGTGLAGEIYGDISKRFKDGTFVFTSEISKVEEGDIYRTKNSIYKVESWAGNTVKQMVPKDARRANVVNAASELCKLMSEEDWHGIISAAESAGCLDAFKKEGATLMSKLTDLAQAVQDYEAQ